ncbi:MAG: hypothetical protein ACOCTG_02865 [Bacteroidota bacterium]
MTRKRKVGLVILAAVILLILVIARACRTDYVDPSPDGGPESEVSLAVTGAHPALR